ncbi:hypothetical protein YTPLAS18_14010 [Nitrospira sp.]|nr:hypothetical protein YTPLAS18_14010 [Nitrospira sp.]
MTGVVADDGAGAIGAGVGAGDGVMVGGGVVDGAAGPEPEDGGGVEATGGAGIGRGGACATGWAGSPVNVLIITMKPSGSTAKYPPIPINARSKIHRSGLVPFFFGGFPGPGL